MAQSSSSSNSSTGSPSPSLSSFPITPTTSSQSTEPPSPKGAGFVFSPTSSLPATAHHQPYLGTEFGGTRSPFASSSSAASVRHHASPRPSFGSGLSRSPDSHSFNFGSSPSPSSLSAPTSIATSTSSPHLLPPIEHCYAFMSASVVDAVEDEDSCPICLELLSLRLTGERPHVVPVCGHRLHHSCFEAVYGDVSRAKNKSSGSLGLCGVCRRDMKIGDGSDRPGKGDKFAKLSGLPAMAQEGPASFKLRSRSRGTHDVKPEQQDDDLVDFASPGFLSNPHPLSPQDRSSHNSGPSSTAMTGSRRGSAAGSIGSAGSSRTAGPSYWDIVKPVVTVRAEHSSVERSLDRDKKQHLTCMVSVEMPSRWPTAPPVSDVSPFDDSQCLPLPPAPSSALARSTSSIRSAPRSASPTPSSVYSAYASGPTTTTTSARFSQVVDDLEKRMADWKGHTLQEFGRLKLHDFINVRKEAASREFLVYLFEEAILCVADDKRKGLGKIADAMTGNSDKLRLKGRVYVRHIRNVVDTSKDGDLSLTITMSDDAVAEFVMLFKERTSLEVWKAQIEHLLPGRSQPSSPPAPLPTLASSATARKLSTPGDSFSESSSTPSFGQSSGGFSGYTRTTNSSLAPLSAVIREEECDHFGQFAHENQQNQPGYASSLVTSPSARSLPLPPPPNLALAPRQFTPLDLMLILSVPASGPTSLKIGILRNSLEFLLAHVGPRTRISLVTYTSGEGSRGLLRKTPFIAVGKAEGKAKLEKAISEIGNEGGPSAMSDHPEERVNVVTACNLALDIVLQRKTKSALTGMILLNDGRDGAQKQQMDLVMARAEAANVPIHTLGYGKSHDPSSLWLLSNHTGGSYTFVKDFYDLRDSLAGCVGGILSIAATNVRLHVSVPEKRWFKIRKVSGTPGAIVSSSGADVDVEIGELRFGERKDLIVEVELSLSGYGDGGQPRSRLPPAPQEISATDAFFLAQAGINPSSLDDYDTRNLYEDEYDSMPDEVPLFEVNAAYRDPAAGKSISRLNQSPCLLTITVNPPSTGPRAQSPPASAPEIVRRRMELLVSDMLSRALLLMTRRNDSQAARLLEETKRIITTISGTLVVPPSSRRLSFVGSGGGSNGRRSISYLSATAQTQKTLSALAQDVDAVHESCLNRSLFESNSRYQAAQQAVVLRDQRAWTSKSSTERLFWLADNSLWMVSKSQQWLSSTS